MDDDDVEVIAGPSSGSDNVTVAQAEQALTDETVKIILSKKPGSTSEAWKYFGYLFRNDKPIDSVHVYCQICFSKKSIARYKSSVSTGNLLNHLTGSVHNLDLKSQLEEGRPRKMGFYFGNKEKPINSTKTDKHRLAREIAMLVARDLLPFSIVEKEGFKEFCDKYGITDSERPLPHRTTVQRTALTDIYKWFHRNMAVVVSKCPGRIGITFDCWTDNYRRLSYITVTAHWIDKNFEKRNANLSTSIFEHPHTGLAIAQKVQGILSEFGLKEKTKQIAVTDNGSNVVSSCAIMNITRFPCLAHGLHNLVTVDLFVSGVSSHPRLTILKHILDRMSVAHRALIYKYSELMTEFENEKNQKIMKLIETHRDIDKILEAESKTTFESQEHNYSVNAADLMNSRFIKPKKDVATRWNSIMVMMRSFVKNKDTIKQVLEKAQSYDKILTNEELDAAEIVVDILQFLEDTTTALSGSSYPTLNIAIILKLEMQDMLKEKKKEGTLQEAICTTLEVNLENRFPIFDEHICAALLTPSMKELRVLDELITTKNTTKVAFLVDMFNQHSDTGSNLAQPDPQVSEATVEVKKRKVAPTKKLLNDLIKKHCPVNNNGVTTEISKYLLIPNDSEDHNPISWWKTNKNAFPMLSKLAQSIFAIPATSAPSERAFSSAGLCVTAKRSSLDPINVNKILFIHDNYEFVHLFDAID